MKLYLGFDIGGTNLKVGLFNKQLDLLAQGHYPNPADLSPESIVEHIAASSQQFLSEQGHSLSEIAAVGIGCPGTINLKEGIIVAAPNLPFRNTPLRRMIAQKLNCNCVLENDANAAAWGEFVAGVAKDTNDMVFFTLGTGIGGGVISDGKMIHGFSDQAGELGHMIIYPDSERVCGCGQRGCAEVLASASHTANRANEVLQTGRESTLQSILQAKGSVSCKNVFEHAMAGDALATEIVDETAKVLGILCVNTLHFTQPKKIVFAGGMIAAGDFLLNKIKQQFHKYIWTMQKEESLEICFATLWEDAGIYGAGALASRL